MRSRNQEIGSKMRLPWILPLAFALGVQPVGGLSCEPFRVLFFWHTSSGEDESFIQQKRLIITLIQSMPNGTAIYVNTVDTSLKSLIYFKKDKSEDTRNWMETIGLHKPGHSGNHIIPFMALSSAVKDFLDRLGEQRIAEEIILFVNKNSVFDNEEKVKETLKRQLTIIVFSGRNQPLHMIWLDLAIDKDHLVFLNESVNGDVTVVSESIMILLCKDSRLKCDTDKYWNGKRCFRCSYLCSHGSKDPSEICLRECPYYRKQRLTTSSPQATTNTQDYGTQPITTSSPQATTDTRSTRRVANDHSSGLPVWAVIVITILACVVLGLSILLYMCWCRKKCQKKKPLSYSTAIGNESGETYNENGADKSECQGNAITLPSATTIGVEICPSINDDNKRTSEELEALLTNQDGAEHLQSQVDTPALPGVKIDTPINDDNNGTSEELPLLSNQDGAEHLQSQIDTHAFPGVKIDTPINDDNNGTSEELPLLSNQNGAECRSNAIPLSTATTSVVETRPSINDDNNRTSEELEASRTNQNGAECRSNAIPLSTATTSVVETRPSINDDNNRTSEELEASRTNQNGAECRSNAIPLSTATTSVVETRPSINDDNNRTSEELEASRTNQDGAEHLQSQVDTPALPVVETDNRTSEEVPLLSYKDGAEHLQSQVDTPALPGVKSDNRTSEELPLLRNKDKKGEQIDRFVNYVKKRDSVQPFEDSKTD